MSDTSTAAIASQDNDGPVFRSFTLDHPIKVGGVIHHPAGTVIAVRKPSAGEFRDLTLLALSQLDYRAIETITPRITQPMLSKPMVQAMDPADVMQLGGEILDFLLPNAAKAESPTP